MAKRVNSSKAIDLAKQARQAAAEAEQAAAPPSASRWLPLQRKAWRPSARSSRII
jgi:hypothetical protein